QRVDVRLGEEIRGPVRTVSDRDVPVAAIDRYRLSGYRCAAIQIARRLHQTQHIPRAQRPPDVAAKLPQGECRTAAQIVGHVQSTLDCQITPRPRALDATEVEHT